MISVYVRSTQQRLNSQRLNSGELNDIVLKFRRDKLKRILLLRGWLNWAQRTPSVPRNSRSDKELKLLEVSAHALALGRCGYD